MTRSIASGRASISSDATSLGERRARYDLNWNQPTLSAAPLGNTRVGKGISNKSSKFNSVYSALSPPGTVNESSSFLSHPLSLLPSTSALGLPTLPTFPSSLPPTSLEGAEKSTLTPSTKRSAPPPIVVKDLERVTERDFDGYIKQVEKEWARWERERQSEKDRVLRTGEELENDPDAHLFATWTPESQTVSENGDLRDGQPTSPDAQRLHRDAASGRLVKDDLPQLDSVPQIFFDSEFNLANQVTWDAVTERPSPIAEAAGTAPVKAFPFPLSPSASANGLSPSRRSPSLSLADLATDQILQEKLSHYLVVIESHLALEISLRSSSFFSALSNLQSLQTTTLDALASLSDLRAELGRVDRGVAVRGLGVVGVRNGRRRLEEVDAGLAQIKEVLDGVSEIEVMVERGEWAEALDGIDFLRAILKGTSSAENPTGPSPPVSTAGAQENGVDRGKRRKIDFSKISCLSYVPTRLDDLCSTIGTHLETETVAVLQSEMSSSVPGWEGHGRARGLFNKVKQNGTVAETSDGGSTTPRFAPPESDESQDAQDKATIDTLLASQMGDRLQTLVPALIRTGGLESAVVEWKNVLLDDIGAAIKELLSAKFPNSDMELDLLLEEGSSTDAMSLPSQIRAVSHDDFLLFAGNIYDQLLAYVELSDIQSKLLSRIASDAYGTRRSDSNSTRLDGAHGQWAHIVSSPSLFTQDGTSFEDTSLPSDLADVVYAVAELSNVRLSRVISLRTDVHADLSLAEFLQVFDLSWAFVLSCEVLSRRMIVGLRGAMVVQAKSFLSSFHNKKVAECAKHVEEERWEPTDVDQSIHRLVRVLVNAAVSDPPDLILNGSPTQATVTEEEVANHSGSKNCLEIEGRTFFAVKASLRCLEALIGYLQVVANCELLTTDAMARIVEFLKSFNSRTCQVVLGAGAMRSAGLKNITARHLALASQSLSVMIALIPYIRETIRRHLNPKQAVMLIEFDKLKRDFQEHQYEIHAKLVAIMQDRVSVHCSTLKSIEWETTPLPAEGRANSYMETLVKETTTLHKVLTKYLHGTTVDMVLSQVFSATEEGLKAEFIKFEPKTEAVREKMLVDVAYLHRKLSDLKGLEIAVAPGEDLEKLIREKHIEGSMSPAPASPLERRFSASVIRLPSSKGPGTKLFSRISKSRATESSPEHQSPAESEEPRNSSEQPHPGQ